MSGVMYYLGCPVWACEKWQGGLFTRHARRDDWLRQYAQVFNTVEGNSTFYGLPSHDTVQRWAEAVGTGFRFVLKFPREISHEKRLLLSDVETEAFLEVLEVLRGAGCLGPSFCSFPAAFPLITSMICRSTWAGSLPSIRMRSRCGMPTSLPAAGRSSR